MLVNAYFFLQSIPLDPDPRTQMNPDPHHCLNGTYYFCTNVLGPVGHYVKLKSDVTEVQQKVLFSRKSSIFFQG